MSPHPRPPAVTPRQRLQALVELPAVQRGIIALIVINSIVLGLETSPAAMAAAGPFLIGLDRVILAVFTIEIALRIAAYRTHFFRDPWSIFDFLVVGISLVPTSESFAVLRALRVLRVLRLISVVPRMRRVVQALLSSLPGLGAVVALLLLIFYVGAVMATKLFGASFPDWFGSLPKSLYSLFQIMTLESWSMGIVRPVMEQYPYAWAFFVPFILVATFTMLNLFIAVVVNAMQSQHEHDVGMSRQDIDNAHNEREMILAELRALRAEVERLGAARR